MTIIPDDIRETSVRLWPKALAVGTPDAAIIIASAILAERERCASQLEEKALLMRGSSIGDTMARIFEAEAVAVRNAHTLVRSAPLSTPPEGREQTP